MPLEGWIGVGIGVVFIAVALFFVIRAGIKMPKGTPIRESKSLFLDNTRVAKKGIRSRSEGLHQPKCIIEYGVLFRTPTGEEKFFLVDEEVYASLEEGQVGTLVVINNRFFSFGDGEEIAE